MTTNKNEMNLSKNEENEKKTSMENRTQLYLQKIYLGLSQIPSMLKEETGAATTMLTCIVSALSLSDEFSTQQKIASKLLMSGMALIAIAQSSNTNIIATSILLESLVQCINYALAAATSEDITSSKDTIESKGLMVSFYKKIGELVNHPTAVQLFKYINFGTAGLVLTDIIVTCLKENPKALAKIQEVLPDVILHISNGLALQNSDAKLFLATLNLSRGVQAFNAFSDPNSTVPKGLNAADVGQHMIALLFLMYQKPSKSLNNINSMFGKAYHYGVKFFSKETSIANDSDNPLIKKLN